MLSLETAWDYTHIKLIGQNEAVASLHSYVDNKADMITLINEEKVRLDRQISELRDEAASGRAQNDALNVLLNKVGRNESMCWRVR